MFLTDEEIRELTGYQRHADQRRWLSDHAWQFEISRIGRPIVGRAYANQRMGLSVDLASQASRKTWSPNIAAIR